MQMAEKQNKKSAAVKKPRVVGPTKSQAQLKLYVWSPALCDHTDGIMVAYARTVGEARALLRKELNSEHSSGLKELRKRPQVFRGAVAYAVHGGG